MYTPKAVRWYLKNMFPHPVTEILLGLLIIGTWYTLTDATRFGLYEFVVVVEIIFLPIYGVLIASHLFRSTRVTLFELSLFNGPENVFVGRLTASFLGLLIGVSLVSLVSYFHGYSELVTPILLKIPTYLSIMMTLMTWLDFLGGTLSFYILTSAVPMALLILLSKPYPSSLVVTLVAYVLAPIGATVKVAKLTLSAQTGYIIAFAISLFLLVFSYNVFRRKDFRP
ncbi:hypothetical protein [Thermococcus sp.]|uniref:hypothetical protein n=1 Tax=Thermococcus sp. TaxID=35749 RepID=UPI002615FB09|nr:hypothetical protein [Thermococcus sp.]